MVLLPFVQRLFNLRYLNYDEQVNLASGIVFLRFISFEAAMKLASYGVSVFNENNNNNNWRRIKQTDEEKKNISAHTRLLCAPMNKRIIILDEQRKGDAIEKCVSIKNHGKNKTTATFNIILKRISHILCSIGDYS